MAQRRGSHRWQLFVEAIHLKSQLGLFNSPAGHSETISKITSVEHVEPRVDLKLQQETISLAHKRNHGQKSESQKEWTECFITVRSSPKMVVLTSSTKGPSENKDYK